MLYESHCKVCYYSLEKKHLKIIQVLVAIAGKDREKKILSLLLIHGQKPNLLIAGKAKKGIKQKSKRERIGLYFDSRW